MHQIELTQVGTICIDKDSNVPVYIQIANGLMKQIRHGHLRMGSILPGTRKLAGELKVHRRTLQMALDELHAQDWIEIIPRKGTFVSRNLPELLPIKDLPPGTSSEFSSKTNFQIDPKGFAPLPSANFQYSGKLILGEGFPDIRIAPMKQLLREIRSIEQRGSFRKYFHYGDPQGAGYLRDTLSDFLQDTRALPITSDQLMITKGAQMGLYLAAQILIKPGDHVVVGDPGYVSATLTFQRAGGTINRIPVDDEGMDIDALEELCKKKRIRVVYVIPHHHQPTTVTLTPERRIRLLNLADRYKFAIIEDDYDYDFHYHSRPIVPIASLDRMGSVVYVGTLTKTIVPAVRMGFLVAPNNLIQEAATLRRSIDFHGDSIMEIAIAELYRSGAISSHIKKAVKLYRKRRDHFVSLLKSEMGKYVSFKIPDGGLAIWCHFKGVDLVETTRKAANKDLLMYDGQIYNTPYSSNATRLGFSSLDLEEQEKAIEVLLDCIEN